jgi:hypothetical protein
MKKLLFIFISILFLVVNFVFAQEATVDINVLKQNINVLRQIVDILQKLIQERQMQAPSVQTPAPVEIKVIQPKVIELPEGVIPALPQAIETKPITPEVIRPILPDKDRSDDVIVQINNLRITRILPDPRVENVKAVFFGVRDIDWKCMLFESEESEKSLPCVLDVRRPILQKELVIQISNDTILLQRNRQRAKLEDFQVGDKINVYGFMDKDSSRIDALIVRNIVSVPRIIEPKFPATSTLQSCLTVITPAYNPQNPSECKEFKNPCGVPPGWIITEKCPVSIEKPKQCFVGGCSSEVCSDNPNITTSCESRPEFACYKKYGKCELQSNNQCGWTMTEELRQCLANPPVTFPTSTIQNQTILIEATKVEADDYGFYPSSLEFTKGAKVKLYLYVRSSNVYYGGLDFRSEKFKTEPVKPGQKTEVEFIADKDFIIESYWPLSNVKKAELRVMVK